MEGWHGWDQYAQFYDWENARTVGRRDISFWQDLAKECGGPVLELGCGTGRVSLPLARTLGGVVGIDRSPTMLRRAQRRLRRSRKKRLKFTDPPTRPVYHCSVEGNSKLSQRIIRRFVGFVSPRFRYRRRRRRFPSPHFRLKALELLVRSFFLI